MTTSKTLSILGARVIDPFTGTNGLVDVHSANGCIVGLGDAPDGFVADRTLNAQGLIVSPGFVDLSARLGEPGYEQKGTIASETAAAVKGGVTHLCCPPDTLPVVDSPAVATLIIERAAQYGLCEVSLVGALTQGLKGEQLSEMVALKNAGCVGLSNGWQSVKDNQTLLRCMEYAGTFDLTLFVNAQESSLSAGGCAHEGSVATRLGLPAIPEAAETISVMSHILLAEKTGIQLHFSQISCKASASLIGEAQRRGLAVTADVAVHQLLLTEENIENYNAYSHCQPPLRSIADREGLRQAVADGVVQAICSDHRPHEKAAKIEPFSLTEPGISGIETLLPLTLKMVDLGILDLETAVQRLTQGPGDIIAKKSGGLAVGQAADLTVFSESEIWEVSSESLVSQGKNTPFLGQSVSGKVKYTVVKGALVYADN